jgi:site-specific recombinase XerD
MLLSEAIRAFLENLRLANASPHTIRNYTSDLEQFSEYFARAGEPHIADIDPLAIRESRPPACAARWHRPDRCLSSSISAAR